MHDEHLPYPELGIETDLLVRLVTFGPDLDDQLGALIGYPVIVSSAEKASLIGWRQPLMLRQRCKYQQQLGSHPLMRASSQRHHVQDSIPHLIARVEAQPAALGEHRLGNLKQHGPHEVQGNRVR